MRLLHLNEIAGWCQRHGIVLDEDWHLDEPSPESVSGRIVYAESGRSGREPVVASECAKRIGAWDECLVWVVHWGVWPNSEDWPAYYSWRGSFEEKRSLDEAPGHLFTNGEGESFVRLLTLVLENAWDAHVLPVVGKSPMAMSAFVSLDGFVNLYRSC